MTTRSPHGLQRELAFVLVDAARKLNDACDAAMRPLGLTRSQWRAIAYISRSPGISQAQLAREMELGQMGVAGLLGRMEHKELVARRGSPSDGRIKQLFLTPKSQALVDAMNRRAKGVLERLFERFDETQLRELLERLETVKDNGALVLAAAEETRPAEHAGG